jgi:type VI protein secretion system component Hcp
MKKYKFIIMLSLVICFASLIFVPDVSMGQLPANAQVYVTIGNDTFEGSIYTDDVQVLSPAGTSKAKITMAELIGISVTKGLDYLSPVLRKYAITVQPLQVVFDFKELGDQPAYQVTLQNAIIQEVSVQVAGSGTNEKVVFAVPEIVCWKYYDMGPPYALKSQTCWDLRKNIVQ